MIGNVVTKTKVDFNKDMFNIVDNINDIEKDSLTLIVGWDLVNEIYPKQVSVLKRNISDKIKWTFTRRERRVEYEDDIERFWVDIINDINHKINYKFINLLKLRYGDTKMLLNNFSNVKNVHIYVYNNSFVYLYFNGFVYGIDLKQVDFIGIERRKIYRKLYEIGEVFFNDSFLDYEIKSKIKNKSIIPYLNACTRKAKTNNSSLHI